MLIMIIISYEIIIIIIGENGKVFHVHKLFTDICILACVIEKLTLFWSDVFFSFSYTYIARWCNTNNNLLHIHAFEVHLNVNWYRIHVCVYSIISLMEFFHTRPLCIYLYIWRFKSLRKLKIKIRRASVYQQYGKNIHLVRYTCGHFGVI